MIESFPTQQPYEQRRQEIMRPFMAYELHNQQMDIDLDGHPLVSQPDAVKEYGINGDIMATITLPGTDTEIAKEIAVIDYGEPDPANLKPVFVFEGRPMPLFGRAKARYGLMGLNYSPDSHMSSHVDFPEGSSITLGRESSERPSNQDANYKLGLITNARGNEAISRNHATLAISNGNLTITDHSTNGSVVRVHNNAETSLPMERKDALSKNLGENAIAGNGLDTPPEGMRRVTVIDPEGKIPNKHYWTK